MKASISTTAVRPADRSQYWHRAIASAYFPLDLTFRNPDRFFGDLTIWQFGDVSVSRLSSDGLRYLRLPRHLQAEGKEEFLVTVPARSEVCFSQCGSEIRCAPGGFFLERSHEPYAFSHDEAADLWVLKVTSQALAERIRAPDRLCSLSFDAANGAGGLFTDMLHLLPARFDTLMPDSLAAIGRQLIDLLVLAIKADERILASRQSSVRNAHLSRIECYIRSHLQDPRLDPETVARACGVSIRYLHTLFKDTDQTVAKWIREQRLAACRAALDDPGSGQTVAEIAYRWGFSDQTQFSRAFKNQYGLPPGEYRDGVRQRQAEERASTQ
ncbi:MAG TPA: helix-turn-helix domain-containing protein [Rhizobiaceae bacterium]|nr:helix-turn-helix domain-containing protein [Rhizobiaceae bacterium]